MKKSKTVQESVERIEYSLEKYKFILSQFPDAELRSTMEGWIPVSPIFASKNINDKCTHFDFVNNYYGLYVKPRCELSFTFKDKTEIINIYSSPFKNLLVKKCYIRNKSKNGSYDYKSVLRFTNLAKRFLGLNFSESTINHFRTEIAKFIVQNSQCELDRKNLDPRLQKLLLFT